MGKREKPRQIDLSELARWMLSLAADIISGTIAGLMTAAILKWMGW